MFDGELPHTPGALLRQEPVPDHLVLANPARRVRVLYTSTNGIDGKTILAVSGAIYVPRGTAPAGGWPIVAWAHGTTGTADFADDQGLGTPGRHPWMAVRPEGWSVLGSVRPALTAFPELANAVVIVG